MVRRELLARPAVRAFFFRPFIKKAASKKLEAATLYNTPNIITLCSNDQIISTRFQRVYFGPSFLLL